MKNLLPDCQELSPTERSECYRAYAEQARSCAESAATEELRQGYLKTAADWLKLAEELQPTAVLYAESGRIYGKLGRAEEAFAALQKAETLAPSFEQTYVFRGNLYLSLQEFDLAEQQYRRALSINASNPSAIRGVNLARRRASAT